MIKMIPSLKLYLNAIIFSLYLLGSTNTLFAAVQTHGPMVGGVTEHTAKIFTRTDEEATISIEYSENSSLTTFSISESISTNLDNDFTAILDITGLTTNTTYFYRVMVDGIAQQESPFPSFRSFAPNDIPQDFKFVVMTDLFNVATNPTSPTQLFQQVKAENPAFIVILGDWDHRNPKSVSRMRGMHQQTRGPETEVGADFAEYISPFFSIFHIWDDHDIGTNNADKNYTGKADALKVYKEYWPAPTLPNPDAGNWHSFKYANAEFFMLDVRSQRDPSDDPDGIDKSMLDGDLIANGQKQWLFDGLLNSSAQWKIIASGVPFNEGTKPNDAWAAYITERTEILNFIDTHNIGGVLIVSGDLHSGGAIDNGENSNLPEMSVPFTAVEIDGTTGPRGDWSEGLFSGVGGGYGLFTVSSNSNSLLMEAKGEEGELRTSLLLNADANLPPNSIINANPLSGLTPLTVNFDGSSSSDPEGFIEQYTWDFDDGDSSVGPIIDHTYTEQGTYNVTLTVTDDEGLSNQTSVLINASSETLAVNSVDPDMLTRGTTHNVSINGSGFQNGVTVKLNKQLGTKVRSTTFVDENSIIAKIRVKATARLQTKDIQVTNPDGQTTVFTNAFEIIE